MNFTSANRFPLWRFLLALGLQILLILAIPAQAVYTHITGKTVILQTAPVDPYDLLRGYSQTLRYEISNLDRLRQLPGWDELQQVKGSKSKTSLPEGTTFYIILQSGASPSQQPPSPWTPIAVNHQRPANLPANQVALQGKKSNRRWIDYGLETYYMPEAQRQQINAEIRKLQIQNARAFLVEVKVDNWGNAVPVSLWLGDQNYRF